MCHFSGLHSKCPISDSQYFLMENGQCLYFEKLMLSQSDAKINCEIKMGNTLYGYGRLFEPRSLAMNNKVEGFV